MREKKARNLRRLSQLVFKAQYPDLPMGAIYGIRNQSKKLMHEGTKQMLPCWRRFYKDLKENRI